MKCVNTAVYHENRMKFPDAELHKREGQWVAFSADGQRIVASATSIAELANEARAVHEKLDDLVLERIELESDEIYLGAAEML